MSDTPDYLVRMKLHAQRPGPNGPYVRTIIGGASVSASFDDSALVGLSIDDDEALTGTDSRLAGVLMTLTAREAFVLGFELQTAARIADATLGAEDDEVTW